MGRRGGGYYDDFWNYEPSRPIETKGGIKARSQRGDFAKNWWATRWIKAIERLVDSGRLGRGRSYARQGQVLSITETKGGVEARVQGSRRTPYQIAIRIAPLSDDEWTKVIDALSCQALFTAQLLAGEMPAAIEEAFTAAGVSLFPDCPGDLETDCSCPDWANPCKHVAATHYILGERFDEDPFLLFRLRGRSQERILQALRERRVGLDDSEPESQVEEPEESVPLEQTISRFWELGQPLEPFPLAIKPPEVALPIIRRLGEPAFMCAVSLLDSVGPAYEAITRAAVALAFAGTEETNGNDAEAASQAETTR